MHFSPRFYTFIFVAAIAFVGCSGPLQEQPLPGSVMVESPSPDKNLLARVVAVGTNGTYTLEVRDIQKDDELAKRIISAPIGYHSHIVSLVWSNDSRTVTATIDHDFGENNRVFNLHTDRSGAK